MGRRDATTARGTAKQGVVSPAVERDPIVASRKQEVEHSSRQPGLTRSGPVTGGPPRRRVLPSSDCRRVRCRTVRLEPGRASASWRVAASTPSMGPPRPYHSVGMRPQVSAVAITRHVAVLVERRDLHDDDLSVHRRRSLGCRLPYRCPPRHDRVLVLGPAVADFDGHPDEPATRRSARKRRLARRASVAKDRSTRRAACALRLVDSRRMNRVRMVRAQSAPLVGARDARG